MLVSQVPAFKEYWYAVAYSSDITDKPRPARVLGDDYVLWRGTSGLIGAAIDECPHRGSRLSQGWVEDGALVCGYHGWSFAPSGACERIPQNDPEQPVPPRARALSVLVEERYGLVWICPGMPRAGIPELPEALDPEFDLIHEIMEVWRASAPRVIDNALDVSHLAWTHRNTIGDSSNPRMNNMKVEREGDTIRSRVSYISRLTPEQRRNTGLTGDFTTRTTNSQLVQPFVFRDVMEYENGLRHVLFKTATPVDDEHTLFCQFIARNDNPDEAKRQEIITLDRRIQAEDKELLEQIRPEFPLEVQTEMHTRTDRMTVEYRRILAELAQESSLVPPDRTWARPFVEAARAAAQPKA
ncbi:aromatic ring-hydroxylating dioxygenase subunit alpha [Kribbella turkmenica]|uniref:Aromatic ring-hydroxylating dioxygenase subunit alpha n=1 Tax=Kribbella turkmenica TaxID=2530375 RepID=A0A4V2YH19_9ACTN|nr:aromatic ring-hydroxylating dioxygenase subunit alpha [Kribbella turkmenica]TDD29227.1 aromatic ring-hydroxylating dioxygenase subunit alpha [Kribbella turkmenica]